MKQKVWKFGNLVLKEERTNGMDYLRLSNKKVGVSGGNAAALEDWHIRWREDTMIYAWITIIINDKSKSRPDFMKYLDSYFHFLYTTCCAWKITIDGMNEWAQVYVTDCERLKVPETKSDDQILEEERHDYEVNHKISENKEES